jgi:hypothetical protein
MNSPDRLESDVEESDVEAQCVPTADRSAPSVAKEYRVSLQTKLVALSFYMFLSLGLTLQSKMLLGKVNCTSP